jgi:hypothetical protein
MKATLTPLRAGAMPPITIQHADAIWLHPGQLIWTSNGIGHLHPFDQAIDCLLSIQEAQP